MKLTDLPTDIIVSIFPYLNAADFLSITSCTPSFLAYRQEPSYWRDLTQKTFRIPPQPLLASDGARWQRIFKSLLTQTHVFTWGNNGQSNLGHSFLVAPTAGRRIIYNAPPHRISWPTEMENMDEVGVVSDVQAGGWSTVVLNSIGQLFAVGILDGQRFQMPCRHPTRMRFTAGYPPTTREEYHSSTAIKQYSVGRCHVMALADSGEIWEWFEVTMQGQRFSSLNLNLSIGGSDSREGRATRVVAGWSNSSAYINGKGIIYWPATQVAATVSETTTPVIETFTIPGTSYCRAQAQRWPSSSLEASIGEVITHIVLELHIVFITHLNKVFAYRANSSLDAALVPTELTTFALQDPDFQIQDIQGSFNKFGIFTKSGKVLFGNEDLLDAFTSSAPRPFLPQPLLPPALQSAQVISLAFGDHHYHALHANGTITSHGNEPERCGAFGLGNPRISWFRGMILQPNQDGTIGTPSWSDGRRTIWFEPEKALWLEHLHLETVKDEPAPQAVLAYNDQEARIVFGEWMEREGRAWSQGPQKSSLNSIAETPGPDPSEERELPDTRDVDLSNNADPDAGAFFALKITAAGWHSGALVLVDHEKAERVRRKWIVPPPPPSPLPEPAPVADPIPQPRHENVGGEEAEGDEVAAPWDQLATAIRGIGNWFYEKGRWFLGLKARDDTATREGERGPEKRTEMIGGPLIRVMDEEGRGTVYAWHGKPFPRIELPGGVMPGDDEITPWRGGRPDWSE